MDQNNANPPKRGHLPLIPTTALAIVAAAAVLALVASSDEIHGGIVSLLPKAGALIRVRPVVGAALFVLFSALAAMFVFVSSAVIVPVAIVAWGRTATMLLLWGGWILGGVCAYTLSRCLGRPIVKALTSGSALLRYEARISRGTPFGLVVLFQLAVPSEIPGYLLGLTGYPFWKYLGAVALAEVPYAIATVYLGSGFIDRQRLFMLGVGLAVATVSGLALYALRRHFRSGSAPLT